MNRIPKDPLQKRLEIVNVVLLAVLVAAGLALMPHRFTLGVFLGGVISIANFHWLSAGLRRAFGRLTMHTKSFLLVRYYIRFVVTGVALYLILTRLDVDIFGLVIGLSLVVVNIIGTAIVSLHKKKWIEEV